MKITLLCDNPDSWINPFIEKLFNHLSNDHEVIRIDDSNLIPSGDMLFILSCEKKISQNKLLLNKRNIVVHPSKLPKGRGWSPLAWQILEGKNKIPVSLFEANEEIDSGKVYMLDYIELKGHELNTEIKNLQGEITIKMITRYIKNYKSYKGKIQSGTPSFYAKRSFNDNELDINKTILEQFNKLRVADNIRYPAFFYYKGNKYILRIERED